MTQPASLAIVIPAWKPDFFAQALDSIARQTDRDFHVYIGDDAGSQELASLVATHLADTPHTYHRFAENLGGKNLVAHWERCLALVGNEEWVWLFSDDDTMAPECVERFQRARREVVSDLYHFPLGVIDESSELVERPGAVDYRDIEEFLRGRIVEERTSTVIEWIFRRQALTDAGGFQPFDMAWGSDDATWVKLGQRHRPVLVEHSPVFWRRSRVNISPDFKPETVRRKNLARIAFLAWLRHVQYADKPQPLSAVECFRWFHRNTSGGIVQLSTLQAAATYARFNRQVAFLPARSLAGFAEAMARRVWRIVRARIRNRAGAPQ